MVARHDHGDAGGELFGNDGFDQVDASLIQRGEWFVQQDYAPVLGQRPGEKDPFLLPTRQLADLAQPVQIRRRADHRIGVELEIAGVNDAPRLRFDQQHRGIGDGVGDG